MRKCFKFCLVAFLLATFVALTSCQEEEPFEEHIDTELTLTSGSEVLGLLKRMVSNDGSYDNIIDKASCLEVQFPYKVVVNQKEIEVGSAKVFQLIEDILDVADDDVDELKIIFPITVVTADYLEVEVNSAEELENLAEQCVEGGDDADIECWDLSYPVTVFTYNRDFQKTGTLALGNDAEVRRFLEGLSDSDLISIDFPVSLVALDGSSLVISSNSELGSALKEGIKACNEDDNNDHNDDDFTETDLGADLVKCPWQIVRMDRKALDNSAQYAKYTLIFSEEGKVVAYDDYGYSVEGGWSTSVVGYRVVVKLEFKEAVGFNNSWYVYEMVEGKIKMFIEDDAIILERYCEYVPAEPCSDQLVGEKLMTCQWTIADEKGESTTELSIGFGQTDMTVYDAKGQIVDKGTWRLSENQLTLTALQSDLERYTGDWQLYQCYEDRIKIKRKEEIAVLTKVCQ